jgi:hypothetical protein
MKGDVITEVFTVSSYVIVVDNKIKTSLFLTI